MVVDRDGIDELFVNDIRFAKQDQILSAPFSQFADGFGLQGDYQIAGGSDLFFRSSFDAGSRSLSSQ